MQNHTNFTQIITVNSVKERHVMLDYKGCTAQNIV